MHPMRRKDRMIGEDEAYELLKNCEYAVMSTVNAEDGAPYGVPVSHAVSGRFVFVHCALEGQKLDNIKKDPRVCLTCVGHTQLDPAAYSTDYECAVMNGRAEVVTDRERKIAALRIICDKFAPMESRESFDRQIQHGIDRTLILKISIDEISGKARRVLSGKNG